MAMASLCLGNKTNQIRVVTWLFQNLVSGIATKQMTRLEATGFSIEIPMQKVLGFRNTLIT